MQQSEKQTEVVTSAFGKSQLRFSSTGVELILISGGDIRGPKRLGLAPGELGRRLLTEESFLLNSVLVTVEPTKRPWVVFHLGNESITFFLDAILAACSKSDAALEQSSKGCNVSK